MFRAVARHRAHYLVTNPRTGLAAILGVVLSTLLFSACQKDENVTQVSEVPIQIGEQATLLTDSRAGTFALRARVRYEDIEALAAEQLPASYPVAGSKRLCKRVIGINVCGTGTWDLVVKRPGKLQVRGDEGIIYISTPIGFVGKVGVQGRVANALGLGSLDVNGDAMIHIALSLQMSENWCPTVRADVSYEWKKTPSVIYQGSLDFSLESIVNDALDKQLGRVEPKLNDAIDCTAFVKQLSNYWQSYSFALDIPASEKDSSTQQVHLNVRPTAFAFSGIHTEQDTLGLSFALGVSTVVQSDPQPPEKLPLPTLSKVTFAESRTDFDLILRANYTQLEQVIAPRLVNREFSANSAAGPVSVTVESFRLSGNGHDVTVALGFNADLPASRKNTNGVIYLQASPIINTDSGELVLDNIRMSRILDSTLWDLVSRVFEGQIIATLERYATLDLSPRLRRLEQDLTTQLADPERTAGINVKATGLSISVLEIVAEPDALAARARVATELDIDIPRSVIRKPLQ